MSRSENCHANWHASDHSAYHERLLRSERSISRHTRRWRDSKSTFLLPCALLRRLFHVDASLSFPLLLSIYTSISSDVNNGTNNNDANNLMKSEYHSQRKRHVSRHVINIKFLSRTINIKLLSRSSSSKSLYIPEPRVSTRDSLVYLKTINPKVFDLFSPLSVSLPPSLSLV